MNEQKPAVAKKGEQKKALAFLDKQVKDLAKTATLKSKRKDKSREDDEEGLKSDLAFGDLEIDFDKETIK